MNQASLALCIVLAIVCTTTKTSAAPYKEDEDICCPPDQINGTSILDIITIGGGVVVDSSDRLDVNIDYKNQRKSERSGDSSRIVTHPDYIYIIYEKKKTCKVLKNNLPLPTKKCLPSGAKSHGSVNYGGLAATAYVYTSVETSYAMTATVTDKDCIFLDMHEANNTGSGTIMTTNILSNPRPVIDESQFVIPPYCKTIY